MAVSPSTTNREGSLPAGGRFQVLVTVRQGNQPVKGAVAKLDIVNGDPSDISCPNLQGGLRTSDQGTATFNCSIQGATRNVELELSATAEVKGADKDATPEMATSENTFILHIVKVRPASLPGGGNLFKRCQIANASLTISDCAA
jgi:hypothetical protein